MHDAAHSGRSSDTLTPPFSLKYRAKVMPAYGPTNPVYDNDVVGFTISGGGASCVGAANIKTGKILWSGQYTNAVIATQDYYPAIYRGKYLSYAVSGDAGIYSVDLFSGQNRFHAAAFDASQVSSGDTYYNNFVFRMASFWPGDPGSYSIGGLTVNEDGTLNKIWTRIPGSDSNQDYPLKEGVSFPDLKSIPCVGNNVLYFQYTGEIHAADMLTGHSFWKTGNGKFVNSVAYENGKLYCPGSDSFFYCLDASNGSELWKFPVVGSGSPVVSNGIVFFRGGGSFYSLDANSGSLKWKFPANGHGYPAISGNIIYFSGESQLYGCKIDTANSNGEVIWQASIPNPETSFGTVIIGDNQLIAAGDNSYLYIYEANAAGSISLIQKPRIGSPVIVKDGENFSIECKGDPSVNGWLAKLRKYNTVANLTVISNVYDPLTCLWKLTAQVPAGANESLYDLEVTNNIGSDISVNSVKVVREIRSNYYYIHISSPLNNFGTLMDQFTLINPEFVVITGDTANNSSSYEYEKLINDLNSMEIPVFIVPGEIQCYGDRNSDSHKVYEKYLGPRYYSFNYGTHKYVGIDTTDSNNSIGNEQMEWLGNELNASANMKTVFYSKDRSNQMPAICDRYGVNCALSYDVEAPSSGVSLSGITPTLYLKTDKTNRLYYSTPFNGFRVVKVNNNKVVGYPVDPYWRYGKISVQYKLRDDGSAGNDGILKGNIAQVTNYLSSSFDNLRIKFLMPVASSYLSNNEIISKIDRGDGVNICKVKAAISGTSTVTAVKSSDIYIGDNSRPTSIITWYRDNSFINEVPRIIADPGSVTVTSISLGTGRYYMKIFVTDGKVPYITEQGGSNFVIGNTVSLDGSGTLYEGYCDLDSGSNCIVNVLVNGFSPELGKTVSVRRVPAYSPTMIYSAYTPAGIVISGNARYYWGSLDGPADFYYGSVPGDPYSSANAVFRIYRSIAGLNDWSMINQFINPGNQAYAFTWTDTTTSQGITYKYRLVTVGRTEVESSFSKEYDVTTGSPVFTNIARSNITSSSAVITWTTDISATTQVELSKIAFDGSTAFTFNNSILLPEDSALVTTHTVTITGLQPNTQYNTRILSRSGDGKINSFRYQPVALQGGNFTDASSFKTLANTGTTISSLKGVFECPVVFPGDKNNITISALDAAGKIVQITSYTNLTLKVLNGGGVFSDNSSQRNVTLYSGVLNIQDILTTGITEGLNSISASASGVTPITMNLISAYPDHYKVEAPAEIIAGENFIMKITAYSNVGETMILPVTITDKKLTLTALKADNSPATDSLWNDSASLFKDGVGLTKGIYNKAEQVKIKVLDAGGKTGVSSLINVKANESNKWKVTGELSKPVATIGDNITISGAILDVYENTVKTSGTIVTFSKLQGNGNLSNITAATDVNGVATTVLTVTDNIINVVELSSGSLDKGTVYVKTNDISSLNLTTSAGILKTGELTNVTIEAKDSGLNPVSGVEVDLSLVTGGGSLSANKVMTDANGQFVMQYLGSNVSQINTIRGQAAGSSITKDINITTVAGDLDHYKVDSSVAGAKAGENFTLTISAMDKCNNLINSINKGLSLSSVLSGYTDINGRGTLAIVTANIVNGTTSITNENYTRVEAIQIKAVDSNGVAGYSPSINIISNTTVSTINAVFKIGSVDITKVIKSKTVNILAILKDAYSNPLNGSILTLSANKGTLGSTKVTTDINGRAVAAFTVGDGICTVTMSSGSVQIQSVIEGMTPSQIVISPANPIICSGSGSLIITIKNSNGDGVPFASVGTSILTGTATFTPVTPADTDAQGVLKLQFNSINSSIDNVVRISCSGLTSDVTIRYFNNIFLFYSNMTSNQGLTGLAKQINASLHYSFFACSGQLVNFDVISGGGSLSSISAISDSNGDVTTNLTISTNEIDNIVRVRADNISVNIYGTVYTGSCSSLITIQGIKAGSIAVNGDSPVAKGGTGGVRAKVYRTDGSVFTVAGMGISFSKTSGVGSVSSAGTTDSKGEAAAVFTAGNTAGDSVINAAASGVSGQTTIKVVDVSAIEATATPVIILTNSGGSEIKAQIKDANGYPVKGADVSFSLPIGTGNFTLNSGATDILGNIKTMFSNTATVGDNVITISSGAATKNLTIKGIDNVTGGKLKLTVPANMFYLGASLVYSLPVINNISVQIVNGNGEAVGVSGMAITIKATGGAFQYYSSTVVTTTALTIAANTYGKVDLIGAGLSKLNFYPVLGNNTITASATGCTPVSVIVNGISTNPYLLELSSDPSSIKPSSSVKVTAKITSGGVPFIGASVAFSLSSTGGGSLSLISGATNDNGELSCNLFSTSSQTMSYVVVATNSDYSLSANSGIPTASASVESFGIETPESAVVNQGFALKIKALDSNGFSPIITSPVTVTISAVSASNVTVMGSGTLNLTIATIINNIDSSVSLTNVTYTAAEDIMLKVTGAGKSSLSPLMSFTKTANSIDLTAIPNGSIAGYAVIIQGIIKDIDGKGVYNKVISIGSTGGTLITNSCVSDTDGKFGVLLTTPGTAGLTTVTANCGAIIGTTIVTTTNLITTYTVTAPATGDTNGFPMTITAKDSSGNVVKSSTTVALGIKTGTGTIGITSVRLTDGLASFTQTYSKAEGGVVITSADAKNIPGTNVTITMTNSFPQVISLAPVGVSNITGGTIQITGKNFFGGTASNNVTSIKLNDTGSTVLSGYTVTTDTSIVNVVIPTKIKAGSYDVLVTTSKGTSTGGVKVTITTSVPVLTSITPNSCVAGETKTISIAGTGFFGGTTSSDVRTLKVGTTTITTAYTVAGDTAITGVIIPNILAAGTYNVVAITGGGDSEGVTYTVNTYVPVPTVASITPASGYRHVSNTLNISGSGYMGGTGSNSVTSVQLVGTSTVTITTYNVVNDGLIQNTVVPVGIAGGTYNLKVTTTGGTSLTNTNTTYVALVDATVPTVLTVTANVSQVKVTFSEDVTLSTVTNKANYTIQSPTGTGNKNLSSATITYSGNMVTIGNLSLTADATFTTTVSNVTDLAGNTIVGSSASGIVQGTDLTAPTNCTVVINGGAGFTGSTNVTLTLSATDANAGMGAGAEMQFSNTGTTWVTYAYAATSTWTLATGTGTATVYAKFSDALGNWTSSSVTNMIVLDTTGPTNCSIVINNGDSYTNNTTVALAVYAEDADSGVSEMQFMNETGSWSTPEAYAVTKSWNITGGDGVKTVNVRYKDNAGNWSEIISGTITLDTTGPVGSIDINSGAIYTKSTIVTLNLSATDHYSGVNQMQFKEGIGSWSVLESYVTGTKILTVTNTDELKTISVRYTDNLNNISLYSKDIKLCTVTKLEVLSQTEMVAGENIAVTVRAVREEGVNSVLVTGYLNKVGFNVKDANAAALPDYTFAGTDSGIKQVFSNLKTLGEQEIEVTDKEIDGITGKVKIKVYAAIAADGTSGTIITNTDGTSVEIPAGAFSGNRQIGFSVTDHPRIAGVGYRYKETVKPISRDFGELNKTTSPWQLTGMTFSTPVKISVPYKQEEIGDVDENSLRLFYYDESSGKYIIVPGKQIISGGKITAQVNHFSTYRVLGTYVSSNLNNVIAYPNPYRPNAGADGKLKIINLPIDCTATIYNIAGEKVREIKEADEGNLGWIDWDGKNESSETVSRGVYLYVVIAPDGSRKISKIALIK
ncbi:MAG: hypothetical protein A2452_11580 [Candidatus Firestonebacteria bacterium RIFOXYC2_FULL_39_67]|nr:MAG: hypothetical protein A2536_01855 [Candidatus Firestonebacteria bacterium RIFOXYD2_FULL_39_29]OGF53864.1 MAG: hypothetical protein A2452_11580 [Candidatus Firestonebacteria bacterium RIFOXYC2_FULL_39_67]